MIDRFDLAIRADQWHDVCTTLGAHVETAGVLHCRVAQSGGGLTLLVNEVLWAPEDSYASRGWDRVDLRSSAYVPFLGRIAEAGGLPVFFHTHPGGQADPSALDTALDEDVAETFRIRSRSAWYASLIVGGSADLPVATGMARKLDGDRIPLGHIRVVGRGRIGIVSQRTNESSTSFDRQARAFGRVASSAIADLHVGIVGLGGTGSAVAEQVVRMGIRRVTVVDDDAVDESNITRVHQSRRSDVGSSKVSLVARTAREVQLGSTVNGIPERVTSSAVALALSHCDVVFGCTDDQRGRMVLSRLAYWYLIPLIDCAVVVDNRNGATEEVYGRVTTIEPGAPCLICRGRVDVALAHAEGLPQAERTRLQAEGYVPGVPDPAPAVVTYTTAIGSLAVNELLGRIIGYGLESPGELLVRFGTRSIRRVQAQSKSGHYCAEQSNWGRGDQDPPLGQLW